MRNRHRVKRPASPLASAVANMLAAGPTRMSDALILVEEYEGKPCVVLRDDSTMTGRPLGYRPIHEGETPSEARMAFIQTIAKHREIHIVDSESDDLPLTLEDVPELGDSDGRP